MVGASQVKDRGKSVVALMLFALGCGELEQSEKLGTSDAALATPSVSQPAAQPAAQPAGASEAMARYTKNRSHAVRVDELKRQAEPLEDGPAKQALLAEIHQEMAGYRASREGLIDSEVVPEPPGPAGMTVAQQTKLRSAMAGFDMRNPADVSRWARLKQQELGR